jgi:hypothetical protein
MSDFIRVDRTLPSGRPITILTPGRRRRGFAGDGPRRRGDGDPPRPPGVGPKGRSHVHPAVDPIAVQTHAPEVSMHDR